MLQEGIKIYFDFQEPLEHRIWLSGGTESVKGRSTADYPYSELAIKPMKPWRAPSEKEIKMLVANDVPKNEDFSSNIAVTKIPEELIKQLQELGVSDLKSKESVLSFYKTQAYEKSFELIDEFVCKYQFSAEKKAYYNYFVDQPDLDVVTLNYNKERVGLHIDNRDQLSVYDSQNGTSIFLLNLSSEDRYFLFVNQSASNIIDWIQDKKGEKLPGNYTVEYINKDFSDCFPEYNVVKLRIKPYEAYIAPAENIIHDGSTEGSSLPGLKFMAGGYFWLLNN
ncbi:hypothetical protein SAMN04515674_10686 [Pseudarcicella hirudinis]|uniref:Uncharacterized protein n=1 Tax=Pseudarcicella hirudinis TaxID=1079859 RepID=A0A1I5TK13_9BACT|nr:hypothetical protein [Pseudarcicella hirudinis]SFP83419.1 hypothetical protein SAMN04515674_10686 [Pseudarcicella hirudinis]